MKVFLTFFFIIFSFFVSAQENKKVVNLLIDTPKTTRNEAVSKVINNDLKEININKEKKVYPEKVKISPEEFYIINDKPVDRVTYLKFLKSNKK